MIYETIYGQPIAKTNHYQVAMNKNTGAYYIAKDDIIRDYELMFKEQCQIYKNRLISRPFIFHADVFQSSVKFDLDNSVKTVLDCLQYCGAITDDNLCIGIHAVKHIDHQQPRVVYAIEEVEPTLF